MNRVTFLIDGFNLYHSIVEASKDLGGASTKWLNIFSLCNSYLHVVGKQAQTEKIYYFSALATHYFFTHLIKLNDTKYLFEP